MDDGLLIATGELLRMMGEVDDVLQGNVADVLVEDVEL
jgi:hypothetical protein